MNLNPLGINPGAIVGAIVALPKAILDMSDNVARLLLNDFYQGLGPTSDQTIRRERQGDVVRAVLERVTGGSHDAVTLGRALGDAAAEKDLRRAMTEGGTNGSSPGASSIIQLRKSFCLEVSANARCSEARAQVFRRW